MTLHDLVGLEPDTAARAQLQDPERLVDDADRAVTIAQVDESLGLQGKPVAEGDGFLRCEIERRGIDTERLMARRQRATAHHDVEEYAGRETDRERHASHLSTATRG